MPNVTVEVKIKPNSRNILEYTQNKITVGLKTYTFSKVHCKISQQILFSSSIVSFVENFLKGENCSILAYGQTGSGKTYTIGITHRNERAVVQNALEMLFKRNLKLVCSFIEIYNESIIDLFGNSRVPLNIRQGMDDINIVGLKEIEINSFEEAMNLLGLGSEKRTTKSTKMNSESSRSHAMFTVILRQSIDDKIVESKMTFVDLAGSERLKRTECTGNTAKESISINTGLLSLGNVISSLYLKKPHIPFRDSKLTRILQKCLTGHVLLLACVSGLQDDMAETTNTLKYASRAALISLDSKVNIETNKDQLVISNLKKEISALKDENNRLRTSAVQNGLKNKNIRDHPFVIELINRLKIYEGEDALQRISESPRETSSQMNILHINENTLKGSRSKSNENAPAKKSRLIPLFAQRHIKENAVRCSNEAVLSKQNTGSNACMNSINSNGASVAFENSTNNIDIKIECTPSENHNKRDLVQGDGGYSSEDSMDSDKTVYHPNVDIELDTAVHNNTLYNNNIEIGSSPIQPGTTSEMRITDTPHQESIQWRNTTDLTRTEAIPVPTENQSGRKRMVTFDLDPVPKKTLFTPLKEYSKIHPRLADSISDISAVSFIIHHDKLLFNCIDSKIRMYDQKTSVVVSDDSIRCICSNTNLYYSTRSLLKSYSGNGRPLPIHAYKREISCLKIEDSLIYTGHEDGSLNIMDMRSNNIIFNEKVHHGSIFDIKIINDQFYSCSRDHSVKFNEIRMLNDRISFTKEFEVLAPPHYDVVNGLLSYKDKCISFSRDCSIKAWDHGSPVKTISYAHDSWIKSGCSLNSFFVTGCRNGILRCWDLLDHSLRSVGKIEIGSGINCMISQDNSVWVGCQNKNIFKYEFD